MNCPNCGRSNPADNGYCSKCGFRLPNAAARGAGITYRRTEQTEPHGGGGQGLLAFGAVLLAGILFAVGAVVVLVSAPPAASPTTVANASVENSLPVFVQPTATPTVPPTPTEVPSFFGSPSPSLLPSGLESPTPIVVPTPTPTIVLPTPTPTRGPPPTPTVTPTPTPAGCAGADGSNMKTIFLGYGNPASHGPLPRAWCIHTVTIRPFQEFGRARLLDDGRRIAAYICSPGTCQLEDQETHSPPLLVGAGSTLSYEFTCADNPDTPVDECNDGLDGGATIQIDYEPVPRT